jgi:hypothetical protein
VGVPFVAADLVDRALGKAHDVERVERDLGRRNGVADRLLIAARHVDRDRPDRVLAVAELVEELGKGGAIAARSAPHDRARAVVDDAGQVAVMAAIGDLVDADTDQALQAGLVEMVGDHTLDDPPDRVPRDPQQARDRRLGHLLRQPRHHILEVPRVARPRPRPRHRLKLGAARATPQPPQLALDHAAVDAEIEVAPTLDPATVDRQPAGLSAPRAHPPPAPQPHRHDHALGGEADIDHRRAGQAQKPVECRADTHVALLAGRLTLDSQQPAARAAACRSRSAQPPNESSTAKAPLTRSFTNGRHHQTARRPKNRALAP